MIIVHLNKNHKCVNSLGQNLVNGVCAFNILMVDPLTMKLGTLIYHGKRSLKQKIQACKKTTSALRRKRIVNNVCAYNLLMVSPRTMITF